MSACDHRRLTDLEFDQEDGTIFAVCADCGAEWIEVPAIVLRETQKILDHREDQNTCRTCKHWTIAENYQVRRYIYPPDPITFEEPSTEDEVQARYGHRVRECRAPKLYFHERPSPAGAAVVDASEYFAALVTGEEFGCVLYEPLDPRKDNDDAPDNETAE